MANKISAIHELSFQLAFNKLFVVYDLDNVFKTILKCR